MTDSRHCGSSAVPRSKPAQDIRRRLLLAMGGFTRVVSVPSSSLAARSSVAMIESATEQLFCSAADCQRSCRSAGTSIFSALVWIDSSSLGARGG